MTNDVILIGLLAALVCWFIFLIYRDRKRTKILREEERQLQLERYRKTDERARRRWEALVEREKHDPPDEPR